MKIFYRVVIGGGLLLGFLFWWYIQVQMFLESGSGYSRTVSPEESQAKGVFITMLRPEPKEIRYNDNTTLIINAAWLEYNIRYENKILWFKSIPAKDKTLIKLRYSFKDKKTNKEVKMDRDNIDITDINDPNAFIKVIPHNLMAGFVELSTSERLEFIITSGDTQSIIKFRKE